MPTNLILRKITGPRAIAMWDFSWIERRWPGAGYEDWDRALDELQERGYDAVRIDAFPHLLAYGPADKDWTLNAVWTVHDWGSPAPVKIRLLPALTGFIRKCLDRGILVSLSSWFREDTGNVRRLIHTPAEMARIWQITLDHLAREGLLEAIWFVDLCNEFPGPLWAPYFVNEPPELGWGGWHTSRAWSWITESVSALRRAYPDVAFTYSFNPGEETLKGGQDLATLDLLEPHLWMAAANHNEFFKEVGYDFPLHEHHGYLALQKNALRVYRARPDYWLAALRGQIDEQVRIARRFARPLVTTECWSIIDYKDWPDLDWGWVKEGCEHGVELAVASGVWVGIATSNFCGPQFRGMWCDIAWHRRLTAAIKSAPLASYLHAGSCSAALHN